jgi:hypothetical protein
VSDVRAGARHAVSLLSSIVGELVYPRPRFSISPNNRAVDAAKRSRETAIIPLSGRLSSAIAGEYRLGIDAAYRFFGVGPLTFDVPPTAGSSVRS